MHTGMRLSLFVLLAAFAVNYFAPLPGLLSRLWVWAGPLPGTQHVLQQTVSAPLSHQTIVADGVRTRRAFRNRIVAIGDLHGDYLNALTVLEMAKVIRRDAHDHDAFEWSGDTDTLIQTGDVVDRGTDTIKLYRMIEKLRAQAQANGQKVISTHGNHEWMNAIGDWRYVTRPDIETFGTIQERQKVISTGYIGRAWRDNYTVAARVPMHPQLGEVNEDYDPSEENGPLSHSALAVCHGGFAPAYPDLTPFPSRINKLGASLLARLQNRPTQPPPHPPNPYPGLPLDTTHSEERLYGSDGPLWYRGWAQDPEERVCARVDKLLDKLGSRRLIMGHTPDFHKIVSRCDGKIIIIDTGISHAYGGVLSALEIVYSLEPADSGEDEWDEHETVNAVYEHGLQLLAVNKKSVKGDFAAWANVQ
ncbi:Metallo-dependent phosphatase [Auriculariales sp. MPI-PUGE-AT-0066]|nr:Metallo-dependent phosphatase [Auriculariales sp. MPI-PUGE-AT-0066]